MAGIIVFSSLSEAIRLGYEVHERTAEGYLVRVRTSSGMAFAIVRLGRT